MITKDQIREVFLRNGFEIKEGFTDLKPYVYAAAFELLTLSENDHAERVKTIFEQIKKNNASNAGTNEATE